MRTILLRLGPVAGTRCCPAAAGRFRWGRTCLSRSGRGTPFGPDPAAPRAAAQGPRRGRSRDGNRPESDPLPFTPLLKTPGVPAIENIPFVPFSWADAGPEGGAALPAWRAAVELNRNARSPCNIKLDLHVHPLGCRSRLGHSFGSDCPCFLSCLSTSRLVRRDLSK